MTTSMNDKYRTGDLVLVKSLTWLGWAIGGSLGEPLVDWEKSPKRASNHNGIILVDGGKTYVVEMLGHGIEKTPIETYKASKKHEFKVARFEGMAEQYRIIVRENILEFLKADVGYDYTSYISHFWRYLLDFKPLLPVQSKAKKWCTELVRDCYKGTAFICFDGMNEKIINPLHIEGLLRNEKLVEICEV